MSLAVGAVLFALASSQECLGAGLLGVVLITFGMATGCLLGIVLGRATNHVMYVYLAPGPAMAVFASWAWVWRGKGSH